MDIVTSDELYEYRKLVRRISTKADEEFMNILFKKSDFKGILLNLDREQMIQTAYEIATKYGEAAAEAACQLHDFIIKKSGLSFPAAEPAETATYQEVAKAINGTIKNNSEKELGQTVGRLVKQAGQDTTIKNAQRDGAEWAWVPSGDTCAYCIMLAGNGWQPTYSNIVIDGHVAHIHANCDCVIMTRYSKNQNIGGYNPNKYKSMYQKADGASSRDKINSMRRDFYAENSEKINEQKRSAYQKRKERESSAAEEKKV